MKKLLLYLLVALSVLLAFSCSKPSSDNSNPNGEEQQQNNEGEENGEGNKEEDPICSTGDAGSVTATTAVLKFTVPNIAEKVTRTDVGVIVSYDPEPTLANGQFIMAENNLVLGNLQVSLHSLKPNTTYYYCAHARLYYTGADGQTYGKMGYGTARSFKTTERKAMKPTAVDLGLSVKWANCNVGAWCAEDYGCFFAWGETEEKDSYEWSNYKYCNGSSNQLTKYNFDSSLGTVDNKSTLDLTDDVARQLYGSPWRMPTFEEIKELIDKCSWVGITVNGVPCAKVTGPNGNYITLPSGTFYSMSVYEEVLGTGYWSSDIYPVTGCYFYAIGLWLNQSNSDCYKSDYYYFRQAPHKVRAVCK